MVELHEPDQDDRSSTLPCIVVVDNDAASRTSVSEDLRQHQFEVEAVSDGTALNKILTCRPVALVVLDILLPGEDGLQIVAASQTVVTR